MQTESGNEPDFRLTRPIVLVGLMGAGKTSVGRQLASLLNAKFFDSDTEIELAAGLTIREIFDRFGEKYFRDGEKRVISRLLQQEPAVIATGGGAFMSEKIRQEIADTGASVWIKADLELLWNRVKDKPTRPLLARPDAKEVLAGLVNERYPIYGLASAVVESEKSVPHELMAKKIIAAVHEHDLKNTDAAPCLVSGENSDV